MWCRSCNTETRELTCPICGQETEEDIPVEIMWCNHCQTPIIRTTNDLGKTLCPICNNKVYYLSTDLRPVFPEERLLLELLLDKQPNEYIDKSVWGANSRYYINGKSISISSKLFQETNTDLIAKQLECFSSQNSYDRFNEQIELFVEANKDRLHYLKDIMAFDLMYCSRCYNFYSGLHHANKKDSIKAYTEQQLKKKEAAERIKRITELEDAIHELDVQMEPYEEISLLGVEVTESTNGTGTVIAQDGGMITVRFLSKTTSYIINKKYKMRPRFENDDETVEAFTELDNMKEQKAKLEKELRKL